MVLIEYFRHLFTLRSSFRKFFFSFYRDLGHFPIKIDVRNPNKSQIHIERCDWLTEIVGEKNTRTFDGGLRVEHINTSTYNYLNYIRFSVI